MGLKAGTQLGPYEVVSQIGAGGMGEVYRARDSRLNRDVALKILPSDVSSDPGRRLRFEQEARAVAALNHPNIVSVYDIGETDGVFYIVSELIEGSSLRAAGLTVRRIIDIAAQVADGLAAAHRAGITHRDLKPDNIMVTPDGRAKILDFGLAKMTRQPGEDADTVATPQHTQTGMVMGTVGYMSPEQVRAKPLDGRSDIFSFGMVLYELLASQHPFMRESSAEVMTAIVRDEAADLPGPVNPLLAEIVRHCLEKDAANRFQSAQDLAFQLRALGGRGSNSAPVPALVTPAPVGKTFLMVAGSLVVLWAIASTALWAMARHPHDILAGYRFSPFVTGTQPASEPIWSSDGRSVAFVMPVDRVKQIFVRPLESAVAYPLTKVRSDAGNPMWTPDGSRILFVAEERLWSIGAAGGGPDLVLTGVISAALSPDGNTLAMMRTLPKEGVETTSIWVSSPPGKEPHEYQPAPISHPGRLRSMHLAFSRDGSQLLASCLTLHSTEVWLLPMPMGSAKPRRLFEAELKGVLDPPSFSWMPDNRHAVVAFPAPNSYDAQLWMADMREGTLMRLTADSSSQSEPAVSPDGKRIIYANGFSDFNIVDVPLDGSATRNLLATRRGEMYPAWSPSGDEYAFVTDRSGKAEIWVKAKKSGRERPLVTAQSFSEHPPNQFFTLEYSPSGESLAFAATGGHQVSSVWIIPTSGGSPVRLNGESAGGFEISPTWSPDGKSIAYSTIMHGSPELRANRVGAHDMPAVNLLADSCAPRWSSTGEWILCGDTPEGYKLVSPDGLRKKIFPHIFGIASTWAADGSMIYGISRSVMGSELQSLDIKTGKVVKIREFGPEIRFETRVARSLRMSLSPGGKSFATTTLQESSDLWMFEGFGAIQ